MFKPRQLRCSFCGKRDAEVSKLVAGPRAYTGLRVYICDACVAVASRLMEGAPGGDGPPPKVAGVWSKLSARARRLFRGGARRVSSPGVAA